MGLEEPVPQAPSILIKLIFEVEKVVIKSLVVDYCAYWLTE